MSTDAQIPGVKNKAVKIVLLVAAGVMIGLQVNSLFDKYVINKFMA